MVGGFGAFIQGIDTIRAFGRIDTFRDRFKTDMTNRYRAPYAFNMLQNLFFTALSGPITGAYGAILGVLLIKLRNTSFVSAGKAGLLYAFFNSFPFQVSAVFTMSTMMEVRTCRGYYSCCLRTRCARLMHASLPPRFSHS